MKSIKYLALAVLSALMLASCSDKEVDSDAPWDVVTNNQAQVQIMYMAPVVSSVANYIYKIEMAGSTFVNKNAAVLTPYNGAPGGTTGLFYTVPAGSNNLKLYGANETLIYDKNFTVEGGKKYQVYVCEQDKEPVVVEVPTIPTQVTSNTAEYFAVRFYNFMWESTGVRSDRKVQLRIQNDETKEYVAVGDPVGFGEATEWLMPALHKTVYNSSGSQRINLDLLIDDGRGNYEPLAYINSRGREQSQFTDYWTEYIGRGYCWILYGIRTETTAPIAIRQWTLR